MSSILSFVREMGSRKSAKNDAFPEFESKGNIHFCSVNTAFLYVINHAAIVSL